MTELEQQLVERLDRVERELLMLRASVSSGKKRESGRVYTPEVAKQFGVSVWTVRRFEGEFAGLLTIKKQTESKRIYFDRKEYEKWVAAKRNPQPRRGMIRRAKQETSV